MNPINSANIAALDLAIPVQTAHSSSPVKQRTLDQYGLDFVKLKKKPAKKGFVSAVRRAFARLEAAYNNRVPYSLRQRLKQGAVYTGKAFSLVRNVGRVANALFQTVSNALAAASTHVKPLSYIANKVKLLSVFGVGGTLYKMAMNIKGLAKSIFKRDYCRGVDRGLMIVDNVSDLVVASGTVIGGLKQFGVIAATSGLDLASNCLSGAGAILSTAMIALHAKHLYQSVHFHHKMFKAYKGPDGKGEDFKAVVDFVNGYKNSKLKARFGIRDGGELKERLNSILQKNLDKGTPETKSNVKKAMKAMRRKLITKHICHGLKILAGVVSIVACAVLLFTPVAPLGFALLAASTALGIGVLATDQITTRQFDKAMKRLAPDDVALPIKPSKPSSDDPDDLEKYDRDMEKYQADLKCYFDNLKYAGPIRMRKWKKSRREELRAIEKEGGLTFEQIRNWTP